MAKPDYPGLVLVPPSDRSILRRRLAKWALLIISLIGGLSSLNIWLPSSDRTRDCQPGAHAGSASPLNEDCTQTAQAIADAPSPQTELIASQRTPRDASARGSQAKSRTAKPVIATPSPKRPMEQAPAQYNAGHTSTPPPAYSGNTTSNRMAASSQMDDSTASLPALPSETSLLSAQHKAAQVPNVSLANSGSTTSNRLVASTQEDDSSASLTAQPRGASQTPTQANPDILLAEQGDAFAQYRLGRFFAQQSGSHSPESVSWYMKASDGLRRLASTGNGKAMYVLGVMYAFGRGVAQNREEARSWLMQAMAHQVPAAGPVLASLDKYRPADSNPPMNIQTKRRQT